MSCDLDIAVNPELVYRLARKPDPWEWPETLAAEPSMNRFDDPRGIYSVLYASSTPVGAYVECLARFRRDLSTEAGLEEVVDDVPSPFRPPGTVPRSWLGGRLMGQAVLVGEFCDVATARTLQALRQGMAARLIHYGLSDLDLSTIASSNRAFTKEVSRHVYECSGPNVQRRFAGISYPSRLGSENVNWALFQNTAYEDSPFVNVHRSEVLAENEALHEAMAILQLTMA